MDQEIIDRAVLIAIKYALHGEPSQVKWIPPTTGSDNPYGHFMTIPFPDYGATDCPPWERI
jgi:hypothetical protein